MAWLKEGSFKTKIVSTREMTQASLAELKNKKMMVLDMRKIDVLEREEE